MIPSKLFTVLTAITSLAVATGVKSGDPDPILPSECITPRVIQCCQQVKNINDLPKSIRDLLENMGIVLLPLPDIDPLVGLTCTGATQDANGDFSCDQVYPNPLCCANNRYRGVIAIDCVPVVL